MQRKRRLVLDLREQLIQAKNARMNNEALKQCLKELQRTFILKMTELEQQLAQHPDEVMDDASEYAGSSPVEQIMGESHEQSNSAGVGTVAGSARTESRSWPYESSDLLLTPTRQRDT